MSVWMASGAASARRVCATAHSASCSLDSGNANRATGRKAISGVAMARRQIEGSRALVTGASSGIGRELARELARRGADVFLVARREDRLQELSEELRGRGRRCRFVAGDITDPATRQAALEGVVRDFGGLDILV